MPQQVNRQPKAQGGIIGIVLGIVLLELFLGVFVPSSALAIPAFARKYDLSCTACHTKPPRLNAFGEAFHMAGYQIPMIQEGETKKKRQVGRIWSELDLLNVLAVRAQGNLVESFQGGNVEEMNLTFPRELELYLAGTLTNEISYFFDLAYENRTIEGTAGGQFEERSSFGVGKEFFLMIDLQPLLRSLASFAGRSPPGMVHDGGIMVMGPMVMIGKIDPSTNFSYPTNRQLILEVPGRVEGVVIRRFGLTPYAFAAKFYGIQTAEGQAVEVTKAVLYNTPGEIGVDLHMMVSHVMLQGGLLQGLEAGIGDVNQKKDPYLMVRVNFGQDRYTSGSVSGVVYWGHDTAMIETSLVNWLRYGVAANLKFKYLDLYGAVIWDAIRNVPATISPPFDADAYGFTIEGDYLATDHLLVSARYDQLNAGGFVNQKANGKTLTLQVRYYLRDNISMYARDSVNVEQVSTNALQSYRNLVAAGVDVDF